MVASSLTRQLIAYMFAKRWLFEYYYNSSKHLLLESLLVFFSFLLFGLLYRNNGYIPVTSHKLFSRKKSISLEKKRKP